MSENCVQAGGVGLSLKEIFKLYPNTKKSKEIKSIFSKIETEYIKKGIVIFSPGLFDSKYSESNLKDIFEIFFEEGIFKKNINLIFDPSEADPSYEEIYRFGDRSLIEEDDGYILWSGDSEDPALEDFKVKCNNEAFYELVTYVLTKQVTDRLNNKVVTLDFNRFETEENRIDSVKRVLQKCADQLGVWSEQKDSKYLDLQFEIECLL